MPRRPATAPAPTPGARVKAARKAAGLTQAQLADRLGIRQPTLAHLEGDRTTVSLDRLARVAAALGVALADLAPEVLGPPPRANRPRAVRRDGAGP